MDRNFETYTDRLIARDFPDLHAIENQARVDRSLYIGDAVASAIVGLFGGLKRGYASLQAWSEKRAASEELAQLDDRMLADLGLTRSDIDAAIDGRIHRQPLQAANENQGQAKAAANAA